jgi:adenylylsulfate kinase-like enzyme
MNLFIAGPSGSGKSTVATGFLERLAEHEYQFCVIDPEGDYETLEGAVTLEKKFLRPLRPWAT